MLQKALIATALAAWSLALGGCHLYFDDGGRGGDGYTYCDDTGCYWCDDWGCYPTGGGDGVGPGWDCSNNADCAAGCYCSADGLCEEAGFCTWDEDCPSGFVCDDRSSCVPEGSEDGCQSDDECPTGSICDLDANLCTSSGTCDGAGDTCQDGYECDTVRDTCVPEPAQTCQGEVVCDVTAPICPAGSTPVIVDGCYSGECMAKDQCPDGAPFACSDLDDDETACFQHASCSPVYKGVNCTNPNGEQCSSEDANCTCESFVYDYCGDK